MRSRLAVALLTLALASPAAQRLARAQAPNASETAAARARQVLAALEYGNVEAARTLMTQNPAVAAEIIAGLDDPRGVAARTAYQVRRQALDLAMDDLARAVQNDERVRGKLVSLEIGGTAGAQERAQRAAAAGGPADAPGFTEKYADLDFQFRTADPESAAIVAEHAQRILGRVPREFGINAFSAPQTPQVAANTTDLRRIQGDQVAAAARRVTDAEAAAGDAMHATELDTYNRGIAYEIDPTTGQRSRTSVNLDDFYEKKSLRAPSYTPDDAFSVTVNEREKFKGLDDPSSAKRVTRASDALAMADRGAITAQDREVIDLAAEINRTRSPAAAVEKLPKDHPVRQDYDRRVAAGASPRAAASASLEPVTARAQDLLDRAVQRSLDVKLASIDRAVSMSDAAIVADLQARSAAGDASASRFMERYDAARRADRTEMLKAARESMVESRKIALAETFAKMKPETRGALAADPRWSGNAHVQNLSALGQIWGDADLVRLGEEMNAGARRAGSGAAAGEAAAGQPGEHPGGAVVAESALGRALNRFDQTMFWMAMSGTLADVWQRRNEALRTEGAEAARAVFAEQVAMKAAGLESNLMAAVAVERLGIVLAESGFPIFRSVMTGVGTGMTVVAIGELAGAASKLAWQYAQEPLLRAYTSPSGPISFYQVLNARPETLRADMMAYARAHKLPTGPHATRQVLEAMAKDYFGRSGVPGANMKGMSGRLVDLLVAQEDRSYDYLSKVSEAVTRDLVRGRATTTVPSSGRPSPTPAASPKEEPAGAGSGAGSEAPSAAAEAARRARERRKAREAASGKATGGKPGEQGGASAATGEDQAARDQLWKQLAQEGKAESDARHQREVEAKLQREAADAERRRTQEAEEAARARQRAEAEAGRRAAEAAAAAEQTRADEAAAAEAALWERVAIDIEVPPALPPGGQGRVRVSVRAPKEIRLAGRRVAIRATPGHTDDGSVPLGAGGAGQTVYTAPAGYNGYVRVTASFEGHGQVSRTFLVGTPVAEAPPEQAIQASTPVTLPETPDPTTIVEIAFTTDEGRGSGRFEVVGDRASGRITYEGTTVLEGEFEGGYVKATGKQQWSAEFAAASFGPDLIQGGGAFATALRYDNGMGGSGAGTHSTRVRLEPGGRLRLEMSIDIESRMTGPGGQVESGRQTNGETQTGTWTMRKR